MEDIKAQLSSLLKRPQAKPSPFALNNDLLQNPKVVAAVLGLLLILSIVFCESLHPRQTLMFSDDRRKQDYEKGWTCYCLTSGSSGWRQDIALCQGMLVEHG